MDFCSTLDDVRKDDSYTRKYGKGAFSFPHASALLLYRLMASAGSHEALANAAFIAHVQANALLQDEAAETETGGGVGDRAAAFRGDDAPPAAGAQQLRGSASRPPPRAALRALLLRESERQLREVLVREGG